MSDHSREQEIPFFLDFVFELPAGVEIESKTQVCDCVTWGVTGTDDD